MINRMTTYNAKTYRATILSSRINKYYSQWYLKAYEKVKQWVGKEYCDKVFSYNQNSILDPNMILSL
ncbi:MAG: hypothetical protein H7X94_11290 [Vallitaleaceae bacterium]|nr:hypothetical protein [Vallitaleaceae bacterium]